MNKKYIFRLMLLISCISITYKNFSAAVPAIDPEAIALSSLFSETLRSEREPIDAAFLVSNSDNLQGFSSQQIAEILQHTKNNQLDAFYAKKTMPKLLKIIQLANYIDCKELFNKTAQKIALKFITEGKMVNPENSEDPLSVSFYSDKLPEDIQRVISAEILDFDPSNFFSCSHFVKAKREDDSLYILDHNHKSFFGHRARVYAASAGNVDPVLSSWNHDKTKSATILPNNTIRIWNSHTGAIEQILRGHSDKIFSVSWNPQGTKLASGSQDRTARIWDSATGSCDKILGWQGAPVFSVSWNHDGTNLAVVSSDNMITVFDIRAMDREIKKTSALTFRELIALDPHIEIAYQKNQKIEGLIKRKQKSQKAPDDCCRLS